MSRNKLFFHLGTLGPGWLVELRPDGLFFCTCSVDTLIERQERIQTTEQKWQSFWTEIDRIDVWSWRSSYENKEICDGRWWTLELGHQQCKLISKGLNHWPAPFPQFIKALETLTARPLKFDL